MEKGEELIILLLRDWIILMIVALGAANRETKPYRSRSVNTIHQICRVVFFWDRAAFEVNHMIAVEAAGDLLFQGRVGQQVAGDLLNRELIEGLVRVECV